MTLTVDLDTVSINVGVVLGQAVDTATGDCACLGCRAKSSLRRMRQRHPGDYMSQLFGVSGELGFMAYIKYVPGAGFVVGVNNHRSVVPEYFDSMEHAASAGIGLVSVAVNSMMREDADVFPGG